MATLVTATALAGLAGAESLEDAATMLFGAFIKASVSPAVEPTDTPIVTPKMGNINRESENSDDAGTDTKATWGDSMREAIVLRGFYLLKDFLWGPGTTVIELFPRVLINPPKGSLLNCHAPVVRKAALGRSRRNLRMPAVRFRFPHLSDSVVLSLLVRANYFMGAMRVQDGAVPSILDSNEYRFYS